MGVGGRLLARELQRGAVGWECVDAGWRLFDARVARRLLEQRPGASPLRQPRQGPLFDPDPPQRLSGCPDAHSLNRYFFTRMLHKSLAQGLAHPMNAGIFGPIGVCAFSSQRVKMKHTPHGRLSRRSAHGERRLYSQHDPMTRDARRMQVAARCNATGGFTSGVQGAEPHKR